METSLGERAGEPIEVRDATRLRDPRQIVGQRINELVTLPLWRSVPSWFIFGDLDRHIPLGAHWIMAERANAKRAVKVAGASHVVGVSHPPETADLILEAASSKP